jgi:hypothetical protein
MLHFMSEEPKKSEEPENDELEASGTGVLPKPKPDEPNSIEGRCIVKDKGYPFSSFPKREGR